MTFPIQRWQVGNVKITRVIEQESGGNPPENTFAGLTPERVKSIAWLLPHYADPDGMLRLAIHAYVLESQGCRIIVDTCVGNDKPRTVPQWNQMRIPFLERLAAAGFPEEQIDIVLCTHLHLDHVGWNTRWDGNDWVPTFPNATYLFGRTEWEHWSNRDHGSGDMSPPLADMADFDPAISDSVMPIVKAALHKFVETDHQITGEISLFPTPGHTPGHVSVAIKSDGKEAVIAGDVMHNPIQLADPTLCATFDADRAKALATRRTFIGNHADREILVLGSHFPTPSAGHIVTDQSVWRFVPGETNPSGFNVL